MGVDADEILGYTPLSEQLIQRLLQIRLLAHRKRTRFGMHFVRRTRSEVPGEALKREAARWRRGCARVRARGKQGRAGLHALIANKSRVAGDYLREVASGAMAKLASSR
jgi:hypothetical protein